MGLFRAAARHSRGTLPILCYHGFAQADEHRFRPALYVTPEKFRARLDWLAREGYTVLPLDEAVTRLRSHQLPEKAVVITIDDGFASVASSAAPVLQEYQYPATVYVTSYYVKHQHPVFRLLVQYLFWKSDVAEPDLAGLMPEMPAPATDETANRTQAMQDLIGQGEQLLDNAGREQLLVDLANRLGVDLDGILRQRLFALMTPEEIRALEAAGLDVQLHTHRHTLPLDAALVHREVSDNRECLEPLTTTPLQHFCYPSGEWSEGHLPLLASLGIKTATTCDPGLNTAQTPPLALKRILDKQDLPTIELEAELCGFKPLLRRLLGRTSGHQRAPDA